MFKMLNTSKTSEAIKQFQQAKRSNNSNGQSLIEMMIAVVILAIVATSLVFGTTVAMRNASFSRDQARATKYAQEAMEWLRGERDADWDDFAGYSGNYCFNDLNWGVNTTCANFDLAGLFKRDLALTSGTDKIEAKVIVSWQGTSGKIHQSELTSYFTKWE